MLAYRITCARLALGNLVYLLGRALVALSMTIGVGLPYRTADRMYGDMQRRAAASRRAEAELCGND